MGKTVTARGSVHGLVQGVWFRGFARQQALAHGLTGYARNQSDGSVAFALTGPRKQVEQVIAALHKGPPAARVTRVEVHWGEAEPMQGFEIH